MRPCCRDPLCDLSRTDPPSPGSLRSPCRDLPAVSGQFAVSPAVTYPPSPGSLRSPCRDLPAVSGQFAVSPAVTYPPSPGSLRSPCRDLPAVSGQFAVSPAVTYPPSPGSLRSPWASRSTMEGERSACVSSSTTRCPVTSISTPLVRCSLFNTCCTVSGGNMYFLTGRYTPESVVQRQTERQCWEGQLRLPAGRCTPESVVQRQTERQCWEGQLRVEADCIHIGLGKRERPVG